MALSCRAMFVLIAVDLVARADAWSWWNSTDPSPPSPPSPQSPPSPDVEKELGKPETTVGSVFAALLGVVVFFFSVYTCMRCCEGPFRGCTCPCIGDIEINA